MLSLSASRHAMLHEDDLAALEAAAIRVLAEVGIRVPDTGLRGRLVGPGFRERGDRLLFERSVARDMLQRERDGGSSAPRPAEPDCDAPFTLYMLGYAQWERDLDTGQLSRFTTESLTRATQLVDMVRDRGVLPGMPGTPTDVAPSLQPVLQYWIGATHLSAGCPPVDPKSREAMPYVLDMADALGTPVRSLPVYVFSPLTLAGESLACVTEFRERIASVGVGSMVSLGCSAPIHPGDAIAMSLAEAFGSAVLLREALQMPVGWHLEVVPIDMRSMSMVFGSPENYLLQLACIEANAFFHGHAWQPGAGNILTNATEPGAQACAEKASLMTAGALLGQRAFGAAGALSLDEAFSAEQFIYDLEIKDHVERLVRGLDTRCNPERCLRDVAEAIEAGSFAAIRTTAGAHRSIYWTPRLFTRRAVGAGPPCMPLAAEARQQARELIARHSFHLPDDTQASIDRILARARRMLT